MKKKIIILVVGLLLIGANIFAQGVSIDNAGNMITGADNQSGALEVTGLDGSDGVVGISSGTGAGVYGESGLAYGRLGYNDGEFTFGVMGINPTGLAGYFLGDTQVHGNLSVTGNISGTLLDETDPTVNASVKDGVDWTELSGIPAGFADGTDDVGGGGGGDITAVYTSAGLSGGSDTGDVTLSVNFAGSGVLDTASRSDHTPSSHTHSANDLTAGTVTGNLSVNGTLTAVGTNNINTDGGSYQIGGNTVLAVPTTGNNTFVGRNAGINTDAFFATANTFIGNQTGESATIASSNTFIGNQSGLSFDQGDLNVIIGAEADLGVGSSGNVIIGYQAGSQSTGSGNIFIGHKAGSNELGHNKLYIDNSTTPTPLIYGDFSTDMVTINDTLKITPVATAPQTCNAGNAGAIYHDSTTPSLCWCDGSVWTSLTGGNCS